MTWTRMPLLIQLNYLNTSNKYATTHPRNYQLTVAAHYVLKRHEHYTTKGRITTYICILQGIHIFICGESWLKPETRIAFKGLNVVRKDRIGRNGGGIAIFIKKSINYCILRDIRSFNNCIDSCKINEYILLN